MNGRPHYSHSADEENEAHRERPLGLVHTLRMSPCPRSGNSTRPLASLLSQNRGDILRKVAQGETRAESTVSLTWADGRDGDQPNLLRGRPPVTPGKSSGLGVPRGHENHFADEVDRKEGKTAGRGVGDRTLGTCWCVIPSGELKLDCLLTSLVRRSRKASVPDKNGRTCPGASAPSSQSQRAQGGHLCHCRVIGG